MIINDTKLASFKQMIKNFADKSEAAANIFGDAIAEFGLKDSVSSAFKNSAFEIKDVIFNDPATIVLWEDGTKTVVKCQPGDIYEEEVGLALCIAKKALGNQSNFNNVFKKWVPAEKSLPDTVTIGIDNNVLDDPYADRLDLSKVINNFHNVTKKFFGGENV